MFSYFNLVYFFFIIYTQYYPKLSYIKYYKIIYTLHEQLTSKVNGPLTSKVNGPLQW